jgi:RNA polymerase sigma factor (sigma-70 family)
MTVMMRQGDALPADADTTSMDPDLLFRTYYHRLLRLALRRLDGPDTAADLVQDTFLRYLGRHADRDLPPVANPGGFLRSILAHRLADHYRAGSSRPEHLPLDLLLETLVDPTPLQDRQLLGREDLDRLHRVIMGLPPRMRLVFALRRFGDLSFAAIASQLGISAHTAECHMVQALVRLRRDFFGAMP